MSKSCWILDSEIQYKIKVHVYIYQTSTGTCIHLSFSSYLGSKMVGAIKGENKISHNWKHPSLLVPLSSL